MLLAVALALAAWAVRSGERGEPVEPVEEMHGHREEPQPERVAVVWETIHLSDDRRTVTVTTSYPIEGFCVKEGDGVDVEVEGDAAIVAAWMRGPGPLPEGTACSMECGRVTQSVTLDEPLPDRIDRFEPVDHAVGGCW